MTNDQTAAQGPIETPIAAAFREWKTYADWIDGPASDPACDLSEEAFNGYSEECNKLADRLCMMEATSAEDLLLKLIAATYPCDVMKEMGIDNGEKVIAEIRAFTDQMLDQVA